jgi:chorismate mutase
VTLFALGITTKDKFSAKRGMNNAIVQDAEVIALLTKMNTVDSSIDIDINGNDADQLRELQITVYENKHGIGMPAVEREVLGNQIGTHAEEAHNASKALELYDKLAETQGFKVPMRDHLDYSLMNQLHTLLKNNGAINKRIGLKSIIRQSEKKKSDLSVGSGLFVKLEQENEEEASHKYNEITGMLWVFFRGLAAVLTKEIDANAEGYGKVMATDSGQNLHVTGTLNACLELMFHLVHKIGLYPTKLADSIFRNAITCVFELHGEHHFDEAVRRAIEYKPRSFQPQDEEIAALEQARRQQSRQTGEKTKGPEAHGTQKKARREDSNVPPCHGQVYHGRCSKTGCQFDHNAARCDAYKKKHPDGPPTK